MKKTKISQSINPVVELKPNPTQEEFNAKKLARMFAIMLIGTILIVAVVGGLGYAIGKALEPTKTVQTLTRHGN